MQSCFVSTIGDGLSGEEGGEAVRLNRVFNDDNSRLRFVDIAKSSKHKVQTRYMLTARLVLD